MLKCIALSIALVVGWPAVAQETRMPEASQAILDRARELSVQRATDEYIVVHGATDAGTKAGSLYYSTSFVRIDHVADRVYLANDAYTFVLTSDRLRLSVPDVEGSHLDVARPPDAGVAWLRDTVTSVQRDAELHVPLVPFDLAILIEGRLDAVVTDGRLSVASRKRVWESGGVGILLGIEEPPMSVTEVRVVSDAADATLLFEADSARLREVTVEAASSYFGLPGGPPLLHQAVYMPVDRPLVSEAEFDGAAVHSTEAFALLVRRSFVMRIAENLAHYEAMVEAATGRLGELSTEIAVVEEELAIASGQDDAHAMGQIRSRIDAIGTEAAGLREQRRRVRSLIAEARAYNYEGAATLDGT